MGFRKNNFLIGICVPAGAGCDRHIGGVHAGKEDKPTYGHVCCGMSGHTEAVQVIFNPQEVI